MIIFGTRSVESTIGNGFFYCPRCNTQRTYRLIGVNRWFTLYFIPVIPMGRIGRYVECDSCAGTFAEEVLGMHAGGSDPIYAQPADPDMSGQFGKPQTVFRPTQTSSLAILSMVFGILSPVFLCACGLSLVTSLMAVICGHVALARIKRSAGMLTGQGMAISGLVLGYLFALLSVLVLVAFLPPFMEGWNDARERHQAQQELPVPDIEIRELPDAEERGVEQPVSQPPVVPPPTVPPPVAQPSVPRAPVTPPPIARPPVTPPPDTSQIVASSASEEMPFRDELVVQKFPAIGWNVTALAFSPDGSKLAIGKMDRSVMLFDIPSGDKQAEQTNLNAVGQVTALSFAVEEDRLFFGGYTGAIQSWDFGDSGDLTPNDSENSLGRHARAVRCLAVSADASFIISGGEDNQLLWQRPGKRSVQMRTLASFKGTIRDVRLSPKEDSVMATDGNELVWIDLKSFKVTRRFPLGLSHIHAASISADGAQVACSYGSEIRVWDVEGDQLRTVRGEHSFSFSWDNRTWPVGFRESI